MREKCRIHVIIFGGVECRNALTGVNDVGRSEPSVAAARTPSSRLVMEGGKHSLFHPIPTPSTSRTCWSVIS